MRFCDKEKKNNQKIASPIQIFEHFAIFYHNKNKNKSDFLRKGKPMNDLKKLSDEQLLGQIKEGNGNAETELFERYKDLVTKLSRGYFIVGGDLEDLVQEGMIGLYKAIRGYSGHRETSFKTFAIICIKHQIQSAVKKANTNKNKPLSSAVSFNNFQDNTSNDSVDYLPVELIIDSAPDEKIIDRENYEKLKRIIKESLSELEYKVLSLYLQGYSYKEISNTLHISNKSIDNSLSRIKTKLRTKLNHKK